MDEIKFNSKKTKNYIVAAILSATLTISIVLAFFKPKPIKHLTLAQTIQQNIRQDFSSWKHSSFIKTDSLTIVDTLKNVKCNIELIESFNVNGVTLFPNEFIMIKPDIFKFNFIDNDIIMSTYKKMIDSVSNFKSQIENIKTDSLEFLKEEQIKKKICNN